ncbi:hypothetical protein NSK_001294 [Nannochloropsis salina CCMP1776]|uniref:Branchpoint-bridging protein n=1 Tax=Nannochloropsis salina CCMP1776 TaxID=1027361 RepID=A0A4D9DGJ6_9STRA|nr:hypothetical protein NSK_001294 [Nannochloropsis salina CCMP1776]|eukprot:TFJ87948.1 hypothetical protein NSK_001294 [Nannochloropsis salina CCMP1776]
MASDGGNADTYAYEEEQERKALLQSLHGPMKTWFHGGEASSIKERFGPYPTFWQDLLTWEHTRVVQKLYLRWMDTGASGEALMTILEANTEKPKEGEKGVDEGGEAQNGNQEKEAEEGRTGPGETTTSNEEKPAEAQATEPQKEEKEQKRRSRWGTTEEGGGEEAGEGKRRSRWGDGGADGNKKKSRWSQPEATPSSSMDPDTLQEIIALQLRLDNIHQRTATVTMDALAQESNPDKSPSPPPIYDSHGKRLNTREERMKAALKKERQDVIERLLKINPLFRPPADYVRQKPFRRLYIPIKEFPTYNFIGLIIGPRGATQKQMEKDTGAKISIRGKGSVKEGSRNRMLGANKDVQDEFDDLHVHVSGETEEIVEKASEMVAKLLIPIDDAVNSQKMEQLRQLALINGTLREDEYCNLCGEKGHRQFECPTRHNTKVKMVNVKCAICGDTSHPTRDCRMGGQAGGGGQPPHQHTANPSPYYQTPAGSGYGYSSHYAQPPPQHGAPYGGNSLAGGGMGGYEYAAYYQQQQAAASAYYSQQQHYHPQYHMHGAYADGGPPPPPPPPSSPPPSVPDR